MTTITDGTLIEMIGHLDQLWAESDRFADIDDTGPAYDALCRECGELERMILVTPAYTAADAAAKQRIVARAELTEWEMIST